MVSNSFYHQCFSEEFDSVHIYWERVVEDGDFRLVLLGGPPFWGQRHFWEFLKRELSPRQSLHFPWHPGKPQGLLPLLRILKGKDFFRQPLETSLDELKGSTSSSPQTYAQTPNRLGDFFQSLEAPSVVCFSHFQYVDLSLATHLAEVRQKELSSGTLLVITFERLEGENPSSIEPFLDLSLPLIQVDPLEDEKILSLSQAALEERGRSLTVNGKVPSRIIQVAGGSFDRACWLSRYISRRPHRQPELVERLQGAWDDWQILSRRERTFLEMVALLFHETPLSWEVLPHLPELSLLQRYWGISEREILTLIDDLEEFFNPRFLAKVYHQIPLAISMKDHLRAAQFFSQAYPSPQRPFEIECQIAHHYHRAGRLRLAGLSYLKAGTDHPLAATAQESAHLIQKAVNCLEEEEAKEETARALVELGWAYYRAARPDAALESLQNSRLLLRGVSGSQPSGLTDRALLGEALVFTHLLNDYERAAARCSEITEREISSCSAMAQIVMGYGLLKRGAESQAEEEIRQGIQAAREKNQLSVVPEGLLYLGTLLRNKSSKSAQLEAESCLKEALQSRDPSIVAKALDGLGRLYASTFKLKEALRFFSLSISIKLDIGDLLGAALSLGGKGTALLRKGLFQEAVECLKRDLEILQTQRSVPASDFATVYCYIADALKYVGHCEEALGYLERAREVESKIPDFEIRNHILGWIDILEGNIFVNQAQNLKVGSLKEEKILEANKRLEDALPRFSENSPLSLEVRLLQVKILQLENNLREAREVLEEMLDDPHSPYLSSYLRAWIHYEYGLLLNTHRAEKHFAIAYEIARKYENDWLKEKITAANDGQVPLGGLEIALIFGEDEVISPREEWSCKLCLYDTQSRPLSDQTVNIEIYTEGGERCELFTLTTNLEGTVQVGCSPGEEGEYRVEIDVEGRARKVFTFEVSTQKLTIPQDLKLSYAEKVVLRKLFPDYPEVEVVSEVGGGLGGSRLFIIQPITESARKAAWVIAKIGKRAFIEAERRGALIFRRYHNLHAATILENHCPECRGKAGIKYVFLSPFGKDRAIIPLEEWFYKTNNMEDFLSHTFEDILSPHFYQQDRLKMISGSADYGRHYPANLRLSIDSPPEGIYEDSPPFLEGYVNVPLRKIREEEDRIPEGTKVILEGLEIEKMVWLPEDNWSQVALSLTDEKGSGVWIKAQVRLFSLLRAKIDPRENPTSSFTIVGTVVSHRSTRLQEAAEIIVDSFDSEEIKLEDKTFHLYDQIYPNPLGLYRDVLQQKFLSRLTPIHGDLTVRNIMVDIFDQPWFIDFEYSQEDGHVLKDFVKLETSVRTFIITSLVEDIKFPEEYVLLEESLLRPQNTLRCRNSEMEKARKMILSIRDLALPHLAVKSSWKEYFRALFLYNLALLKHCSEDEIPARRLNFLTAAILGKALRD